MTTADVDRSELEALDPFTLFDRESARLDRFLSMLADDGWERPTRCEGWRARDLLAHLVAVEEYTEHGLDDRVDALFAEAAAADVGGLDDFNDWGIGRRADRAAGDLVDEWRRRNAENRRRLRERGRDGTMGTSVGPYPSWLQTFHLALELATHADDLGVPVTADEAEGRVAWRAAVCRFAVREAERPVEIERAGDANRVRADGVEAKLRDDELVEAVMGRLPQDHPLPETLREALSYVS